MILILFHSLIFCLFLFTHLKVFFVIVIAYLVVLFLVLIIQPLVNYPEKIDFGTDHRNCKPTSADTSIRGRLTKISKLTFTLTFSLHTLKSFLRHFVIVIAFLVVLFLVLIILSLVNYPEKFPKKVNWAQTI